MTVGIQFTECYVAFLDLLGVRNLVKRAGEDSALYEALVAALAETKNTSTFWREERNVQTNETKAWRLQVQAFSDCVVLFIPTESNMLPWLLASVRRLWDRLIRLGVCLRGAVTIDGMHWDTRWSTPEGENRRGSSTGDTEPVTPIAFGPGLVEAYKLESECAVYPRILIANALFDHVEKLEKRGHPKLFPLGTSPATKLSNFFRHDFDGLWHLDLLHPGVTRRDVIRQTTETDEQGHQVFRNHFDETTPEDWLQQVRAFIEKNLADCKDEKLLAKYQWLARYYNNTPGILKPFCIFKDALPAGAISLTARTVQPRTQ